jgi:hypothetical protein
MLRSTDVVLLMPARGAQWIARDEPFNLDTPPPLSFSAFASDYFAPAGQSAGVLRITVLRRAVVVIDGQPIFDNGSDVPDWRHEYRVTLPAQCLTNGTHHLKLLVANRFGPPVIRADCAELGIRTGEGWTCSMDQHNWSPAVLADRPRHPEMGLKFPDAPTSMKRYWPLVAALFAAGAGGYGFAARRANASAVAWSRWIKWTVMAAWLVLAWNNLFQVPGHVGYDAPSHLEYVRYIAQHWRLPLPDELWESFHPPLYFFCSAVLYRLLAWCGANADRAATLLRLIPLFCGVAMVELCHRAAARVFPGRQTPQAVAAVFGGLLPVNLYMAQAVSNEPMAACLCGIITLLCLNLLLGTSRESEKSTLRNSLTLAGLGLILGLAILTKLSSLLWLAPCAVVVWIAAIRRAQIARPPRRPIVTATGALLIFFTMTFITSGWYFIRNYHAIGVAFLTHSTIKGTRWWQEPGFRAPAHFMRFGTSVIHPVFGDLTSIWDDLYSTLWSDGMLNGVVLYNARPPWNYELMACGLWLALAPMLAIAAGASRLLSPKGRTGVSNIEIVTEHRAIGFASACLALFLIALMYVCLSWPIYSDVKSSYLLGLTPCLAILFSAGFSRLTPTVPLRAIGAGLLTCWAGLAYLTYFVW